MALQNDQGGLFTIAVVEVGDGLDHFYFGIHDKRTMATQGFIDSPCAEQDGCPKT